MSDSDGVRYAGRILRSGGLNRLIECIAQEVFAGFWLDSYEPIRVLGFKLGLQAFGIKPLSSINDKLRLG
jgi:hypothetical protein